MVNCYKQDYSSVLEAASLWKADCSFVLEVKKHLVRQNYESAHPDLLRQKIGLALHSGSKCWLYRLNRPDFVQVRAGCE